MLDDIESFLVLRFFAVNVDLHKHGPSLGVLGQLFGLVNGGVLLAADINCSLNVEWCFGLFLGVLEPACVKEHLHLVDVALLDVAG